MDIACHHSNSRINFFSDFAVCLDHTSDKVECWHDRSEIKVTVTQNNTSPGIAYHHSSSRISSQILITFHKHMFASDIFQIFSNMVVMGQRSRSLLLKVEFYRTLLVITLTNITSRSVLLNRPYM